jgi:hypothetical protein
MNVQTSPLPLTVAEYKDNTTKRLHFLVDQLVLALTSSNPEGVIVAISTLAQYFTFVLEVLEKISNQKEEIIEP